MNVSVEFHFDFGSPNAYLAQGRSRGKVVVKIK